MPKVSHYRNKCIGCNSCVEVDGKHWEMCEEDGRANLKNSDKKGEVNVTEISELEREDIQRAIEVCPVDVIKLEE